jgi:hypothetical protein
MCSKLIAAKGTEATEEKCIDARTFVPSEICTSPPRTTRVRIKVWVGVRVGSGLEV